MNDFQSKHTGTTIDNAVEQVSVNTTAIAALEETVGTLNETLQARLEGK